MSKFNIPEEILNLLSSFSFRGNSNLRNQGAVVEYTEEMVSEYIKCASDPIYFIRHYAHVVHLDRGVVLMDMYPYQEKMVEMYHKERKVVVLTPRQYGKTVTAAMYLLWYLIFNDNKTIAVLANKQATADEILHRIRLAYEALPKWLQQGVVSWGKRSIEVENGSRIFCAATSSSGIRGKSINILYLDEIGFIENNLAEEFFTSVYPTISSSQESKIIMTSTPHGFNHFYKYWDEAEKGVNGFVPVRVHWTDMPGRTQEWYNEQKKVLGELKAAQELDCEFLGSSRSLLSGSTLARLTHDIPIKEYTDQYNGLKVYREPEKDHIYSMAVDVSRGRHLDYSTFVVYDITSYPHTIAATYRNNDIPPMLYASLIEKVGRRYNEAYLLIEINDIGAQVADILWNDLEYGNMHWTKSGDELGKQGSDPYPGIRTTKKTKRIGCANLKDLIDNNQLLINDYDFIHELSTFVQSKTGSYEADEGFHDDVVMCGVLHAWLVSQRFFNELTDQNLREAMHDKHIKEMEDQIMLNGFYDDGMDDYIQGEDSIVYSNF